MSLNHVGIVNKDENQAVEFYQEFLGLEKLRDYVIAPDLSKQLFSVSGEIKALVFGKENVKIEIFISPEFTLPSPNMAHFCLHLDNFSEILERAEQSGVAVISGSHKDKTVHFLRDFSGNLIEIKPS